MAEAAIPPDMMPEMTGAMIAHAGGGARILAGNSHEEAGRIILARQSPKSGSTYRKFAAARMKPGKATFPGLTSNQW